MLFDILYSLRSLRRTPGLSCVIVLSLALGIGANATALCWLQHLYNDALPGVERPGEMVIITSSQGGGNVSLPDLRDFGVLSEVFEGTLATQNGPVQVRNGGRTEWLHIQLTTANFFELLGVRPVHGRMFLPDEDRKPGGNAVVVISEDYWTSHLNRRADVLGRTLEINRHPFTIIGVAPKGFCGTITGLAFPLWVPVSMSREVLNSDGPENRFARMWHNLARLRPGVDIDAANAALTRADANLAAAYPASNERVTHRVRPLSECPWGAQSILIPVMTMVLVMSLLVWLLVVANVTNLILSRAVQRRQELAIRSAAGAGRWQLVRLMLAESLAFSLLGGALGLLLATWMVELLTLFLPQTDLPTGGLSYKVDLTTVVLTCGFTVLTGLLVGLLPALRVSRGDLAAVLKEGGRSGSEGVEHGRLRNMLVVAEVALAVVMLVSAGLCLKGFSRAREKPIGMDPKGLLIADLHLGMQGYTQESAQPFYAEIQRRLASMPGVESAALSSWYPLGFSGCKGTDARPEGYQPQRGENTTTDLARVSPGYFATMKIPLRSGRDFTDADRAESLPVVIVNEAFAAHFWPGQEAVGRTVRSGGKLRTVVGVAAQGSYYRVNESPRRFIYQPSLQGVPDLDLGLCVRVSSGDPLLLADAVRKTVKTLDPAVDLRGVMRFEDHAAASLFADTIAAGMLGLLGLTSLALAALGIYAVMSYNVSRRMREFGIRMALGADRVTLISMVLRQSLVLVLWGVALGLVCASLGSRVLGSFLNGVSPFDPLIFLLTPAMLTAVGLLACLAPSWRATQIDPVEALRR